MTFVDDWSTITNMNRNETKKAILDVGMKLVLQNGYNHTGLNEVLALAGVPKGSFYYYFANKEDFGLQLIDQFHAANKAALKHFLEDETYDPLTRLRRYFQTNVEYLVDLEYRQGCLLGNLGQELSDQNETFRLKLKEVMQEWASSLAACLKQAQEAGQISPELDTCQLGEFFLNNWQGSLMRMKIIKSRAPLDQFIQGMFGMLARA